MKCVSNENIHSGLVAEFPRICIYTQQKVSRKVNPSTFFHTLTNFHFLFTVTLTRYFHQPKTRYFIKVHIYHPLLPELLERMNTKTNVNAIPYNYDIPCHNKKNCLYSRMMYMNYLILISRMFWILIILNTLLTNTKQLKQATTVTTTTITA